MTKLKRKFFEHTSYCNRVINIEEVLCVTPFFSENLRVIAVMQRALRIHRDTQGKIYKTF